MSRSTTTTCDGCGKAQDMSSRDIYGGKTGKDPFWHVMYSSSDFPSERGGYRLISGGWDLCSECCTKTRAAIKATVGDPDHDSWDEVMAIDKPLGISGKLMLEGYPTEDK